MIKEIETKAGGAIAQPQVAAAVQTSGRQFVLRSKIKPDPNQPRKEFKNLHELADSLKADGFLEVLKVRLDKDHYTLIDGERRWRASEIAGIERVPIEVIEAKDVLKVQLLYGTQRENLNALEQAQTAQRLLEERRKSNPKYSVEELGKELGLKRATVYELMALNKVSEPVRQALLAGKLDASKARCFATVPASEHVKLLKEALEEQWGNPPMSVRELEEHIEQEYSRQLKGAPFDQTVDVIAPVGDVKDYQKGNVAKHTLPTCARCPKRSGNIEGWVGSNPNVCTDVKCFEVKTKLFAEQKLATAKARGQEVIPAEDYQRKTWDYAPSTEKNWSDSNKRTWGQLGKAAGISPRLTVNSEGAAVEVFTRADKAAITSKLNLDGKSSNKDVEKSKELAALKKRREALAKELLKPILLGLTKVSEEEMMLFLFGWNTDVEDALHEARLLAGWPEEMKKLTPGQRRAALMLREVECAYGNVQSDGEWGEEFADAARLAGLDLKAEEKKVTDAKPAAPAGKSTKTPAQVAPAKGKKK